MAKIPMGNFGNAMPQVQRIQMPQDHSGQMIANSLQNVGQVAAQADQQQREREVQAKQLELYNNQLAEKEGQLKVDDFLSSKFSEQTTLLRNDVANGVKTTEQANQELKTWTDEKYKELSASLPMHVQHEYKAQIDSAVGRQGAGFLPLQIKADEQKNISVIDRAFNIATRLPTNKREEYLNTYLINAPISEIDKDSYRQKLRVESNKIDVDGRILSAVDSSNIDELRTLSTELDKGAYKDLNGGQVQDYQASIASKIHTLQQRQQQQANKRESEAKSVLSDYVADLGTGLPLSPERQKNVLLATKGTPYEADALLYAQNEELFQKFRALDTNAMQSEVLALQASMLKNKSDNPTRDKKIYDVYYGIYKEKLDSAKNDPVGYAVSQNQDIKRITGIEVVSNPAQAVKNILHNDTVLQIMRKTEPNITLDPIGKDDLDGIKQALERATIPQTLGFMSQLVKQVPKNAYGQNLTEKIFKQLGNGSDSYLFASQALANNLNYKGTSVASGILQGQRLIQQKNMIIPSAVETDFRAAIGNLAQKGDFKADLDALSSMYAFYASKRGISHAKKDDGIDEQTFKDAFNAVTGGVYTQQKEGLLWGTRNANFTLDDNEVDSWQVEMPYGMDESKFKPRLEDSYKRASELSGIPVSFLKSNYRLQVRDNTNLTDTTIYDLLNANGEKLTTKDKNGKTVGYFLRVYRNK